MTEKTETPPKPARIFTRSLRVQLTSEERSAMAIELAGETGRLRAATAEKEESAKHHGAIIKAHEGRMGELAANVNSGFIYRDVEVHELYEWDRLAVIQIRKDTGEEIDQRPMSESERQRPLKFPSKPELVEVASEPEKVSEVSEVTGPAWDSVFDKDRRVTKAPRTRDGFIAYGDGSRGPDRREK